MTKKKMLSELESRLEGLNRITDVKALDNTTSDEYSYWLGRWVEAKFILNLLFGGEDK